jgi:hypothetical protein
VSAACSLERRLTSFLLLSSRLEGLTGGTALECVWITAACPAGHVFRVALTRAGVPYGSATGFVADVATLALPPLVVRSVWRRTGLACNW